ncbi:SusC/RagA family TonB-linked outer membrane protein [Persicobacter diffluens]|uniref:SusC/RagA family TonB-linked outer membrane protein n=1 Tax=Persicobacter diffluens TaxID=981 RepID=A0AAN5ALI5_9BACT|nr:SusC/RagA family TonB-linked outer membrane protein [Persicobacter diffluens]
MSLQNFYPLHFSKRKLFRCATASFLLGTLTFGPAWAEKSAPELSENDLLELALGHTVKGRVYDAVTGEPIIGVTVAIEGTNTGSFTDIEGNFMVDAEETDVLVVSFVGYESQRITVGTQSQLDIALKDVSQELAEVVVTALGIKRTEKSLGYAASIVPTNDLAETKSTNFTNSLAGKVAGLQVVGSTGGVAGSSRITLRGESSLNLSANGPLFVIDGVPISNNTEGSGDFAANAGNLPVDFGNGASELSSDDIEDITVLKGANAAALYGSRAANGVIMITTKKGQDRFQVDINANITFESLLMKPRFQDQYGPAADKLTGHWGERMDGSLRPVYGPNGVEMMPNIARGHTMIEDFFETGVSATNNVAISGGNGKDTYRLSYTNTYKSGITPSNELKRNSINYSAKNQLTDKLTLNTTVNYIHSGSDNITAVGHGAGAVMYNFYDRNGFTPLNADVSWGKNYWMPGMEHTQQYSARYMEDGTNGGNNPYFVANEFKNTLDKNRLIANFNLNYEITEKLSSIIRGGTDFYNEHRTSREAYSSTRNLEGMYREEKYGYQENNFDWITTFKDDFGANWKGTFVGGMNLMSQKRTNSMIHGIGLTTPGVYSINNFKGNPTVSQLNTERAIMGVYGTAQMAFKDFWFIDVTARNDWSSTLVNPFAAEGDQNKYSFFYPSVSSSLILSDIMDMPKFMNYAKVRGGFAMVGNDTDPYMTYATYVSGALPGTNTNPGLNPNANLKPEMTTSYEFGLDAHFFNSRLTMDLTYYHMDSRDQILVAPVSTSTGYTETLLNAGHIQNRGIEIAWNAALIENENFKWNFGGNFTRNYNEIKSLAQDIDSYVIARPTDGGSSPGTQTVIAEVGARMGALSGYGYQRVQDPSSPYHGMIIYNEEGQALRKDEAEIWGNYNPDWTMGLRNEFSYKNWHLSALFDIRKGGSVYSYFHSNIYAAGLAEETLPGREGGLMITDGVYVDGDGNFRAFEHEVDAQTYYTEKFARNNMEANTFDATFVKLRELSIGYSFPRTMIAKVGLQSLRVSAVGRNLWMWSKTPYIDPENMTMNAGYTIPGFEVGQLPSTRNFGFNINMTF